MGSITPTTELPVDILIVGDGIARLSAAATIMRQDHTVVILDSRKYRNARSPHMHTVATCDHRNPVDWRAAARKDFKRYGTVTVKHGEMGKIMIVESDSFKAISVGGKSWSAGRVILATGVEDVFPDIPGYAESWITGIFHCLYCHWWEEKGTQSSGVIAEGECAGVLPALHFARQALRISKSVIIYTHGNTQLAEDVTIALKTSPAPSKSILARLLRWIKRPTARRWCCISKTDHR